MQVTSIIDDKPFAEAGVRVGDIITAVNGKKPDSAESLRRLLTRRPGHRRRDRSAEARRQDGDGESGAAGVRALCSWMIP